MMMQVLAASGVPIAADDERVADESNPRGYFELDAVKRIRSDGRFLAEAVGCAIKVVAPLLRHLPDQFDYRIIFMERDLDEVLDSQRAMLRRDSRATTSAESDPANDAALKEVYSKQIPRIKAWLTEAPHITTLFVSHADAIHHPEETIHRVADFIETDEAPVDDTARIRMTASVDPKLHRHRSPARLSLRPQPEADAR